MSDSKSSLWEKPWPQPSTIRVPLAGVHLSKESHSMVNEALTSNWIGPGGIFNKMAEDELSRLSNTKTLLVSNGSVALSLALAALNIGPGDEVLVPALTFAATASAVVWSGASPVFCDSNLDDWIISIESMREALTPKTKAIIVVHLYGVLGNMKKIMEFARENELMVIEDSAEALFANRTETDRGDVTTYSFFANKLITSGEGGAVSTDNLNLYKRMEILRGQGMDPSRRYYFLEPGFNFRMSNLQAAVLMGQLTQIEIISEIRLNQENRYQEILGSKFTRPEPGSKAVRVPWIYTAAIEDMYVGKKFEIAEKLAQTGIETRPVFYPLDEMPAFQKFSRIENSIARCIASRGISLPTGLHVSNDIQDEICEIILTSLGG
jgi:perosamine synthetase